MALDVRVKHLDGMLCKKAFMEMFIILHQCEPRFKQLIISFHVHHIIFVKLKSRDQASNKMSVLDVLY